VACSIICVVVAALMIAALVGLPACL